jgi:hypothetical protein
LLSPFEDNIQQILSKLISIHYRNLKSKNNICHNIYAYISATEHSYEDLIDMTKSKIKRALLTKPISLLIISSTILLSLPSVFNAYAQHSGAATSGNAVGPGASSGAATSGNAMGQGATSGAATSGNVTSGGENLTSSNTSVPHKPPVSPSG